jgi:hypothetical protein
MSDDERYPTKDPVVRQLRQLRDDFFSEAFSEGYRVEIIFEGENLDRDRDLIMMYCGGMH